MSINRSLAATVAVNQNSLKTDYALLNMFNTVTPSNNRGDFLYKHNVLYKIANLCYYVVMKTLQKETPTQYIKKTKAELFITDHAEPFAVYRDGKYDFALNTKRKVKVFIKASYKQFLADLSRFIDEFDIATGAVKKTQ